jgi:hypothetical protein
MNTEGRSVIKTSNDDGEDDVVTLRQRVSEVRLVFINLYLALITGIFLLFALAQHIYVLC